jgi:hypothetical protein
MGGTPMPRINSMAADLAHWLNWNESAGKVSSMQEPPKRNRNHYAVN